MAMSKSAVDVVADSNHQVRHRISQLVEVPEYVKSSAILDADAVAALPQTVFADPVNRKFPLNTKAATWLAQTYFDEARHLYDTQLASIVQDKITKAAAYWAIEKDVKKASATIRATQSRDPGDRPSADFAMCVTVDGKKTNMLPIHSEPNVKAAAARLYNYRMKFPYEWRKIAARKILHKAAELNVEIEPEAFEYLHKAASRGSAIPARAAEKLGHRVLMIPEKNKREKLAMAKLVKTVDSMKTIPDPSAMEKLAGIVDQLDRQHGFYRYYNQGVETPEEIFFDLTQKKAEQLRDNYVQLTTGTVIPFNAIIKLPLSKISAVIGDDFAKAVTSDDSLDVDPEKFARIARTLPRDDATLLEKALRAAGAISENVSLADVSVPN